ncbi:dihydroxyacetone kinase subunit DhaK [Actinocatenispora rupis]|uniref:Dihydroxyacetone kinase subunit DhaK n=1 Tax=Actinocatenispora rupis TaxID=519421 RepID=A0A8J3J6F9_9ACTN|nr:dihydroxyacetone kinase subunit DhaK [Actinocatenispora rupis]GID12496.1 dihydroxyacetone kinase subunit DhaK [Actinocatenispora rupis]
MKRLYNRPDAVVDEAVEGLALVHPDLLRLSPDPMYVTRADAPVRGRVALVSGGGSGHEPMHVGFVGPGMLSAACPGAVFTSPTADQVEAAARAVDGGAGVLLIVKNYSGDVMNFEMAAELLAADGIATETVLVADDVAVEDSTYTSGRRGVGATVLVEKICGAAAERGADLAAVAELGRKVAARSRSLGLALSAGTVPATGRPGFVLADDEIEFGVGIHGEPGRERRPMEPADALTDRALAAVLDDFAADELTGDVLLFVNGLGSATPMECAIVARRAVRTLGERGLRVARSLVGQYMTSLDMLGVSLTVLRLDDDLARLWDDPVETVALRWGR